MTTIVEKIEKINREKKKNGKYMFDPEAAGVSLNKQGQPTDKGWELVTPEMWKFRFSVADKIQVDVPDYFADKDAYVDMTPFIVFKEIIEANPNEPLAILVAKTYEKLLDTMPMKIRPYEMVIGLYSGDEHGMPGDTQKQNWVQLEAAFKNAPERMIYWKDGKKVRISAQEMQELREKIGNKYNASNRVLPRLTEHEYHMYFCPEFPGRYAEAYGSVQRASADHDWYMRLGWRKLVEMKREKLKEYEKEYESIRVNEPMEYHKTDEILDKINNAKAQIRVGEAVIRWFKRWAEEARKAAPQMAEEKARLIAEQAAANCDWVAENAPRTFWEAAQMFWGSYCIFRGLEACHPGCFKPDSLFWEWYERDVIKEKTLDKVTAGEILASIAAKWSETGGFGPTRFGGLGKSGQGTRDYQVWTIGGQDKHGKDATNDLTRVILDVWDGYRFHYPDLKFRWFPGTKKDDFRRVCEVIRTGLGLPSLRNDPMAIETLLSQYPGEFTLEQARQWGIVGCNTPGVYVDSKGPVRREAHYADIEKAMEFTLFNGWDPEPGFEWAKTIETGDPTKFEDFEEFYQAWLKQYMWFVTFEARIRNMHVEELGNNRMPFVSLLYKSCMESGLDALNDPTISKLSFQSIVGWVDTIDSLAAVKYLIYDKKKYTMEKLLKALKADWEGYEDMRRDFRNAPKFGNDSDYVDEIMVRATDDVFERTKKETPTGDTRGYPVYPNQLPVSRMFQCAPAVGALPNGRKRGEQLCDGGINPHADFDKSGVWARLRSALKADQGKARAYIYNQRLDYSSVEGEAGLDKFADYCWTAMEQGQTQMQFNLVSSELLRDAQKHPEKYPYLTVRVSGYNAFFAQLPTFMQDAVASRVEQKL
jgi:pyruvate-formate lyase